MQSQIVILSGGRETYLLQLRNEVLKSSGYTVVSAHSATELIENFRAGDYDLVLLCHSFNFEERRRIVQAIHSWSPSTPVLMLASEEVQGSSTELFVTNEPVAMLNAINGATSHRFQYRPRERAS